MEEKMTVADYLKRTDKDLVVTGFIRYALSN